MYACSEPQVERAIETGYVNKTHLAILGVMSALFTTGIGRVAQFLYVYF